MLGGMAYSSISEPLKLKIFPRERAFRTPQLSYIYQPTSTQVGYEVIRLLGNSLNALTNMFHQQNS